MTPRLHCFKAGTAHDIDGLQGGVEVPVRRIAESRTRCLVRLSSPPGGGRPRQTEPTASRTFIRAARRAGEDGGDQHGHRGDQADDREAGHRNGHLDVHLLEEDHRGGASEGQAQRHAEQGAVHGHEERLAADHPAQLADTV